MNKLLLAGVARAPVACAAVALMVLLATGANPARAQEAGRRSGLSPTLDTRLSFVDTQRPVAADDTDFITELRPGFRFFSRTGRVQGSAAYSLGLVNHTQGSDTLDIEHLLSATLNAEAVEKFAFIDAQASASKQALSAFGPQSVDRNRRGNANLSEVANASVSPYVRGTLATVATYDLRLNAAATRARRSISGDSTTTGGSVTINSANQRALVAWGLNGSTTSTDFRGQGKSNNDRAIASLSLVPDPELTLTARGGREATNIGIGGRQTFNNWGGQVRWLPTERTIADVSVDRRFFGDAHAVTLSHRFPLSSIRFTSTRDINLGSNGNGLGQPQTLYQLFFTQFASLEPDPVLRDQLVRNFLAGQGLDPNAGVGGGFVNSGATVQQRQDLALSYSVRRLTLALQGFINRSRRFVDVATVPGGDDVNQRGYNSTLSYRLTPTASVSLNGSRLITKATPARAGTDLKSLAATWSDRLGARATAGLSARYSVFNSSTDPYREVALSATLAMGF